MNDKMSIKTNVRERWVPQTDGRRNEQQVKGQIIYLLIQIHTQLMGRWQQRLMLRPAAKDTTDDNSVNPVSPLPPSLSIPPTPSFSQSFYR